MKKFNIFMILVLAFLLTPVAAFASISVVKPPPRGGTEQAPVVTQAPARPQTQAPAITTSQRTEIEQIPTVVTSPDRSTTTSLQIRTEEKPATVSQSDRNQVATEVVSPKEEQTSIETTVSPSDRGEILVTAPSRDSKTGQTPALIPNCPQEPTTPPTTTDIEQVAERRTFQWQHKGSSCQIELEIPGDVFQWSMGLYDTTIDYYNTRNALRPAKLATMTPETKDLVLATSMYERDRYTPYANEAQNVSLIKTVANELKAQAEGKGYNELETAEYILGFIQSIPYKSEVYMKLPVSTLCDGGDCECKSVLFATILRELEYDTVIVSLKPQVKYEAPGHVVVGILFSQSPEDAMQYYDFAGSSYCAAETTQILPIGEVAGNNWNVIGTYPIR